MQLKYENIWPVKKVPLRTTPHFIAYSIEHKVYLLFTTLSEQGYGLHKNETISTCLVKGALNPNFLNLTILV